VGAAMSGLLIGYNNLIDNAALSGGSWKTTNPIDNVKSRVLSKSARSFNLSYSSTQFDIDLGVSQEFRLISLYRNNLNFSGTYRIRLSDIAGSFTVPVYDSGTLPVLTYATPNLIHVLPDGIGSRYIRVELFNTFNPAAYVEISRVFVGPAFSFNQGISRDADIGYVSSTTVQSSLSGVEYFDKKTLRRRYEFSINQLSNDEAYNKIMEIQRLSDISEEIVIIPDLSEVLYQQKRNFLGRLNQLSPIKNPYFGLHQTGFEIIEIV
jgi:hypothetical protein